MEELALVPTTGRKRNIRRLKKGLYIKKLVKVKKKNGDIMKYAMEEVEKAKKSHERLENEFDKMFGREQNSKFNENIVIPVVSDSIKKIRQEGEKLISSQKDDIDELELRAAKAKKEIEKIINEISQNSRATLNVEKYEGQNKSPISVDNNISGEETNESPNESINLEEVFGKETELISDIYENDKDFTDKNSDTEIVDDNKSEMNCSFEKPVFIENIYACISQGEVVYTAKLSNDLKIVSYPNRKIEGRIFANETKGRKVIKELLSNFADIEYKVFDKSVVRKIDIAICDILTRFANEYNYNEQDLIYDYAMSYSRNSQKEIRQVPQITYNLFIESDDDISKKEKESFIKMCKKARRNKYVKVIGNNGFMTKIKGFFNKTMALNEANPIQEKHK